MKDYQLDGNKEMVALGTMNIVGSMTSCYIATGNYI
jgi:MFS superfamily sulfate permease-like transporter